MKIIRIILMISATIAVLASCSDKHVETEKPQPRKAESIYMIGASIVAPENTWFEIACEQLGLTPINRAISGIRPSDGAVRIFRGGEFSFEELDSFDLLAVMHVHNQNICDESKLLEDYHDYDVNENMDYSQAFDYIIRKYIDECRALEHNPDSKWFGIEGGKPVKIMLCTYWHDARVVYNTSIRRLAERWKNYTHLCAFDENIGFTKDEPDPVTGEQISIRFAQNEYGNTEVIDGVTYGWHPTRGKDSEIQFRMARIFADAVREYLGDECLPDKE